MNQWIFLIDAFGMKFEGDGRQVSQFTTKISQKKALEDGTADIKKEGIF
jgi:hypothetical protein